MLCVLLISIHISNMNYPSVESEMYEGGRLRKSRKSEREQRVIGVENKEQQILR